jgi:hypothetical protein
MREAIGQAAWLEKLEAVLPFFGHRNWIVVADSAYPAHSAQGIETVIAPEDHLDVLRAVFEHLDACAHVRPAVYIDSELAAVPEANAPGVAAHRNDLDRVLAGRTRVAVPHETIIARLDEAASRFCCLIIKTSIRIPYTSVFLELECGYRTTEALKGPRTRVDGSEMERR